MAIVQVWKPIQKFLIDQETTTPKQPRQVGPTQNHFDTFVLVGFTPKVLMDWKDAETNQFCVIN